MSEQLTQELIDFIDNSPSMFHTIKTCREKLDAEGFVFLDPKAHWEIKEGGKYYTMTNASAIAAFCVNSLNIVEEGFKIVGTHSDTPGFRIKPNPQIQFENYIKLNTEIYGGPILNTWLDRPLSIAGRIAFKGQDPLHPSSTLVNINRPLLVIPNLAIHMNKEINNGVPINKQKDILPILAYLDEIVDKNFLQELISKEINVPAEDILDMDLFLHPFEKSMCVGLNNEFISAPRLDDLSMTYSALYGIINNTSKRGISLFACFDNEEVGSRTRQGADSPFLANILERILISLSKTREEFFIALENSFMISADVAHLIHPNYPEKSDITNKVLPGKGPAIKINSCFSYTTDSDSYSTFAALCKTHAIPYQVFVNRSDEKGGSTIGPVLASHLTMRSIDIGTPILSMHSVRELMTEKDFIYTCKALLEFFNL
ncbi:M18 family aminopeptidase [Cellulosilyticum sp. I15G10I2]|uniref:M18 family aminopeptidase n=1 Tax=Cellulosilyticum sp. I15G10I2 TaxID=1892843 RepID=UPI00085C5CC9|nr:M18 family aminopeptidase [Cellulosilyticum sp. I15G10I2]